MNQPWTWITPMRDDGEHPTLRGQIAMRARPDGGAEVTVMAARGTFATDVVISAEDVQAMVAAFAGAVPQRAEPWPGAMLRMHECGQVESFPNDSPPDGSCDRCESGSLNASDWRPLYVLGGAA